VLQTHARLHKIPIDELTFEFEVLKAETPEDLDDGHVVESGVLIHGFFMDGARWNREEMCIDDQLPVSINKNSNNLKFTRLNSNHNHLFNLVRTLQHPTANPFQTGH